MLNIIAFGAHPDDCDQQAGGTAALWAALGHRVRFVSVTNGDAGHQTERGAALAARRRAEAIEAGRRVGVDYVVLDHHDGQLLPTLEARADVIRLIREWRADLVLAPRPNDYHPDHRYTGALVQDSAYIVLVPNIVSDAPPLRRNPVFILRGSFPRPDPVPAARRRRRRRSDRSEDRHDRRARVADVRMAAVGRRARSTPCRQTRRVERTGSSASGRPPPPRQCATCWRSGTDPAGRPARNTRKRFRFASTARSRMKK